MNKKRIVWALCGVAAVVLIIVAWQWFGAAGSPEMGPGTSGAGKGDGKGGRKDRTLDVRVAAIRPTTLTDGITVSGSLLPEEEVDLSFETSGKITQICFAEGAHVSRGQLLATINDAPLQAQKRKLTAQLKLMQDRLYRQRALLEKEAVSREAFQEAEANLATLRAEIDAVDAQIAQTQLRAPFSGIIGLRRVSTGAYATTQTTVATLTQTRTLRVEFSVPERYAGLLRPGAALSFTVEGDLKTRRATVYAADARVDADTRTYAVRGRYDNADGALVPGRYVSVSLSAGTYANTLAVPSEAVIAEMGRDKVFVCRGGKAQPVEIVTGLRTDSSVQVVKGLSEGDSVIVSGIMQLRTGQKVRVIR